MDEELQKILKVLGLDENDIDEEQKKELGFILDDKVDEQKEDDDDILEEEPTRDDSTHEEIE